MTRQDFYDLKEGDQLEYKGTVYTLKKRVDGSSGLFETNGHTEKFYLVQQQIVNQEGNLKMPLDQVTLFKAAAEVKS